MQLLRDTENKMRNIGEYHRRHGRLLLGAVAIALAINAPTFAQQASVANVAASESTSQARWIPTGNLNVARWGHTATLLPNGKVLVVGGANADFAWDPEGGTSAELYDPATGSWTLRTDTRSACVARCEAACSRPPPTCSEPSSERRGGRDQRTCQLT